MEKRRPSLLWSASCCFRGTDVVVLGLDNHRHLTDDASSPHPLPLSPTATTDRRANKPKRRSLMSCFRFRNHHHQHRRWYSSDFSYDPLSYALNFDDGPEPDADPSYPVGSWSFSARLPITPDRRGGGGFKHTGKDIEP